MKRTSQLSHKSVSQLRRSPRLQKRALPSTSTLGQGCAHKDTTKYHQLIKTLQRKLLLFRISSKVYGQTFMTAGSPKDTKLFTQKYRQKAPFGSQLFDTLAFIYKILQKMQPHRISNPGFNCFFIVDTNEKYKFQFPIQEGGVLRELVHGTYSFNVSGSPTVHPDR